MAIQEFPFSRAYRLGPLENTFDGVDQTAAELARDTYFSANPSKLAVYNGNSFYLIRLTYTTVEGFTTRAQGRLGGAWFDYTPFLQGLPGEVASLIGVPIGEIPYKTETGLFSGSGMRVLEDGTILAPPGFGVESGSVTFGDVLKLSEVAGFLGIFNLLNDRQYTIVDFYTPRNAASSEPTVFHLIEPEFEFISQGVDTTNLPDNPLIYNYTVVNNARTNSIKFRTFAAMTNVRIKISQVSNGVVLKYLPNKTSWEKEIDGLTWISGDNSFDFTDSPVILSAGVQLRFEIRADVVALKGNATGIPYFTATLQRGVFDDVITDRVYTAENVKAKLESLVSPDKLTKAAIQDVVNTVNGLFGDVVITKSSVGLGNADNTSDVNKPVSTAQGAAITAAITAHNAAVDPHPQYTTTAEASAAAPVQSVNLLTGNVSLTTTNIPEGGSLYYTDSRVGSYLSTNGYTVKSASSLGSGSPVYKANTSGDISFRSIIGTGIASVTTNTNDITINVPANAVSSVNGQTGAVVLTTTNIAEGTNLYYTDARVGTYLTTNGYTVKSVTGGGIGASVYNTNTAGSVSLRNINGAGLITVTQNTGDITIDAPTIASGNYTPTLFNTTNVATSVAHTTNWVRVGNMVTVSGRVEVDPTNNNQNTTLGISLPIASNLTISDDVGGTASAADVAGQCAAVLGDVANDRALLQYVAGSANNHSMWFTFMYEVI